MRRALRLSAVVAIALGLCGVALAEPPLNSAQQKIVDESKAGLDAVEVDLTAARTKLDAGDVAGAMADYQKAVAAYNKHISQFGKLPANQSDASALREKAKKLGATLKETAAALRAAPAGKGAAGGNGAPVGNGAGGGAGAPGTKLDSRTQQTLKDAKFYLNEVESRDARLSTLTAGPIDADAIKEARDLIAFITQRLEYAGTRLKALPSEHPDVAPEVKRFEEYQQKLAAAQKAIDAAAPEAAKQTAALGQQMTDDLALAESWSEMLRDPRTLFHNKPKDAVVAIGQLPQMKTALAEMLTRWTERAKAKPNDRPTADMVGRLSYVEEHVTALDTYTKEQAKTLPGEITKQLAEVDGEIQQASAERRPLWFAPDSGIANRINRVEDQVAILRAIDPAVADASTKELDATRTKAKDAKQSLAADIIKGNTKPEEKYKGADVEDLRAQVTAKFKEVNPNSEIVAVIFNTPGWTRTTRWDWGEAKHAWYKVDFDQIQPKVFVKLNDTQAVSVPVEIYKDYMNEGRLAVKPWDLEKEPSVTGIYSLDVFK